MTTRRRRAGSESIPFDSSSSTSSGDIQTEEQQHQLSGSQVVQHPTNNINNNNPFVASVAVPDPAKILAHTQVPGLTTLGWGSSNVPSTSPQEAYYKKTDAPLPTNNLFSNSNSFAPTPNIFTPINTITNSNSNSGYPIYISDNCQSNQFSSFNNNSYLQSSGSTNTGTGSFNPWQNFSEGISSYIGANFNSNSAPPVNNNPSNSDLSDLLYPSDFDSDCNNSNDISSMACRDRSGEFAGIIRSQQQVHLSNGAARGGTTHKATKDLTHYSAFMKRSKMVGRNISSTYAKLEKLTLLARKRSLFDDSQDTEVQELTAIIRHDLGSLTKQLEELQRSSAASHASHNSPNSSAHMQKHSANLVGSLQTKVASITSKFRDVLEVRTENLKRQAARREQFTGNAGGGGGGGGMASSPHSGSVLLADEAKAAAASRRVTSKQNGDVVLDFDGVSAGGGGGGGGGAYQQQLMLMEEQDSLLQSRAETMKTIESTIVELGTMFTQLATMVKEQDELVYRIDANVDDAEMNIEAGHTELLKYFKSVSSNRWLMMKVFGIVVVFFIIFVVFMA